MEEQRIEYLIRRLIAHELSAGETEELERFLGDPENEEAFTRVASHLVTAAVNGQPYDDALAAILAKVMAVDKLPTADLKATAGGFSAAPSYDTITPAARRAPFLKTAWFRYAALLLLIAGTATFLYINEPKKQTTPLSSTVTPSDILPGGNKAMLTLSDGSTIILDSVANGAVALQGSTKIVKLHTGSLAYEAAYSNGESRMNTITTPRGGQYQVTLPDGSGVWLNAESSVTFPVAFGKERKIVITGEAYLEVQKDTKKPFIVSANATVVEVLGTSFNINAYQNEPKVTTSLLKGSIRVAANGKAVLLKPGEQSSNDNRTLLVRDHIDPEQILAWKNGTFYFSHTPLADAMRQIARWYDVEVVYENGIPDIKLGGEMKRDLSLSRMLIGLGKLGVSFRIENKQLIVINDDIPVK